MKKFLNDIGLNLYKPVIENLPFFVTASVLLLPHVASGFLNDALNSFTINCFSFSVYIVVFNVSEVLAFAYLCCLLFCHVKIPFIKILLYVFVLLIFGINIYLRTCFGTLFSSNTMLLILETNTSETLEFLETFGFRPMSIVIIISLLFLGLLLIAIEKWYHKRTNVIKSKVTRWVLSSCVCLFLFIAVIETVKYVDSFRNQTFSSYEKLLMESTKLSRMDYCRRMICSIYFMYLLGNDNKNAVAITQSEVSDNVGKTENDSLTILVVIGESFVKVHASTYGYSLNTMPNMDEQKEKGNLVAYNNVITTANRTSVSLRNFFSCNSVGDGERWCEAPFFPAIIKSSGYDVYFWDNQYDKYSSSDSDFALNAYIHNPAISALSYNQGNDRSFNYDGELIEDFINSCFQFHNKQKKNRLIMFHLMGQHFKTDKRYPHTDVFCRFNADSIRREAPYLTEYKKKVIAQYDNAILYNDFVLNKIIELFQNQNAIMIFFSDHGELVYDVSDVLGRTLSIEKMSPAEMAHNYDIPMMFWYSNIFKTKHPEIISTLENNKDKPFMSDNICHILFHIGNIHTRWYQPKRDILNQDYQCPPRLIENSTNYDKKRNTSY